jgi:hypothetical protein
MAAVSMVCTTRARIQHRHRARLPGLRMMGATQKYQRPEQQPMQTGNKHGSSNCAALHASVGYRRTSKGVDALRIGARTMRLVRQQHQARRRAVALERREEALRLQRVRAGVVVILRHGAGESATHAAAWACCLAGALPVTLGCETPRASWAHTLYWTELPPVARRNVMQVTTNPPWQHLAYASAPCAQAGSQHPYVHAARAGATRAPVKHALSAPAAREAPHLPVHQQQRLLDLVRLPAPRTQRSERAHSRSRAGRSCTAQALQGPGAPWPRQLPARHYLCVVTGVWLPHMRVVRSHGQPADTTARRTEHVIKHMHTRALSQSSSGRPR